MGIQGLHKVAASDDDLLLIQPARASAALSTPVAIPPADGGYTIQTGSWRADTIYGGLGSTPYAYLGLGGDDRIYASGGNDWLEGGSGDDFLDAGAGNDVVWGGTGADFIRTGAGSDRLIFVAGDLGRPDTHNPQILIPDVVEDFDPTQDVLEFYGFSSAPVIEQIGAGPTVYVLLKFPDGTYVKLNYVSAAQLTANPNCIRMMSGPGPTPTPEGSGIPVVMTSDMTTPAGLSQTFTDGVGYVTNAFQLTNHGTITVEEVAENSTQVVGVIGGRLINSATGVIQVVNNGMTGATGAILENSVNAGRIEAASSYNATGVYSRSTVWEFSNSGTITATAGRMALGVYLSNEPIATSAPQRARITLDNSGTIRATGDVAIALRTDMNMTLTNSGLIEANGVNAAIAMIYDMNGSFTNTGTIRAVATNATSIGVLSYNLATLDARGGGVQTYENRGLIEADIAILVDDSAGYFMQASTERILNSGQIRGHIYLGLGNDELRNNGEIHSDIDLGGGADLFDGSGGLTNGLVFGGEGDDRLLGGRFADILFGGEGADAIYGGGGDDLIDGGRGSDALDGGAGFDTLSFLTSGIGVTVDLAGGVATAAGVDRIANFEVVWGSRFADTMTGSNFADTLEGFGGNDVLDGGGGDDVLSGGRGDDILTGGGGSDTFVFTAGDGADTITDLKIGSGLDRVLVFGYAGYQSVQQIGADTLVILSDTDRIWLRNVDASRVDSALVFDSSPLSPPPSLGPTSTMVLNDLLVIGAGEELAIDRVVDLAIGGTDLPASGLIFQDIEGATRPSIVNMGRISIAGGAAHSVVAGVQMALPSNPYDVAGFLNGMTGVFELVTGGSTDAIGIAGIPLVYNQGSISVIAGGDALGIDSSGDVVNTGAITIRAGDSAVGIRNLPGLGDIWNSGPLDVFGRLASTGIEVNQSNIGSTASRAFANSGLIRVADQTAELDSVGVLFGARNSAWLVNSGIIEADYAIRSYAAQSGENRSYIINTGQLRGRVDLGGEMSTLFNDGLITGRVDLGAAADIYDGRLGTQTGGVFGGDGDDVLMGGSGNDVFNGGAGADLLWGGAGDDVLTGGGGADRFLLGPGMGADIVTDFSFADGDRIYAPGVGDWQSLTQVGADVLVTFGTNYSVLVRDMTVASITRDMFVFGSTSLPTPGGRSGLALTPPPPVIADTPPIAALVQNGTSSADVLVGGAYTDTLFGRDGDDRLDGGLGNDLLDGGAGADILHGGDGHDRLFGGDGDDRLIGGAGNDELRGGACADIFEFHFLGTQQDRILDFNMAEGDRIIVRGVSGSATGGLSYILFQNYTASGREDLYILTGDTIDFGDRITIEGTSGNDVLRPIANSDGVVYGMGGDDNISSDGSRNQRFYGGDGNDYLFSGAGDDQLFGDDGDDTLIGGFGSDILNGGAGTDTAQMLTPRSWARLIVTPEGFLLKSDEGGDRLIDVEIIRFSDGRIIDLRVQYGPDGWGAFVDDTESGDPFVLPGEIADAKSLFDDPLIRLVEHGLTPPQPDVLPGLTDASKDGPPVLPGEEPGLADYSAKRLWHEAMLRGEHDRVHDAGLLVDISSSDWML